MKAYWKDGGGAITGAELEAQGIFNTRLPVEESRHREPLAAIMARHGYVDRDLVEMSPGMKDFEAICEKFSIEHYHPGDEVRFILEGSGVWEIRSLDDRLMKVEVQAQDFIVVPAHRYHFFYLTPERRIRCVRLFKDHNGWTQVYRKDVEAGAARA